MRFATPAAIVTMLALALAGCGSGGSSTTGTGATTTSTTTTTTSSSPVATTATGTTTVALPGTGRPPIAIGDKNFTEQFILGELYDLALSAQGYNVTLNDNIGTTSVTVQALKDGALDMYPEYLNIWDSDVAGYTHSFRTMVRAYAAGETYAAAHGFSLLDATPFSDTPGIGVTTALAQSSRLRTLFDLRRIAATLTIGVPLEFQQSPSDLPAIEAAYGFKPAKVEPIDIGAQYQDLISGSVQAAYVTTTDGELSFPAFTLLRDPLHVLGFGNVIPVVRTSVLAAEGPVFVSTIDQVSQVLTNAVMRQLDAEVDIGHMTATAAARLFLQQQGIVPPS
jgi:osmoprotectant transport system substrate-binding protein